MIDEGIIIQNMNQSGDGVEVCRVCGKSCVPLSVVTPDDDSFVNARECMLYELTSAGKSFPICETCEGSLIHCAKGIINHLTRSNVLKPKDCRCCFMCGTVKDLRDSKLANKKANFTILERIRQRFGYKNENDKVICKTCRVGFENLYLIHSAVSETAEELNYCTNTLHDLKVSGVHSVKDKGPETDGSNSKNEGIAEIYSPATSIKKEVKCTPVINNSTSTPCEKTMDDKLDHLTPALTLNKEEFDLIGNEAFKIPGKGGETFKVAESENQQEEHVAQCIENDYEPDKSDGIKICRVCGKSSVPLSVVTPDDDFYVNAEECMLYELTSAGKSFSICETCESSLIQCAKGINHLKRSHVFQPKNCRCCFMCGTIRDLIEWKVGNTMTDFAILERIRQRFGYKNENDKVICMSCRAGFLNLYRIYSAVSRTVEKHSYSTNALHDPQVSDVHSATDKGEEIGSNLKNELVSDMPSTNDTGPKSSQIIDNSTVTPCEKTVVGKLANLPPALTLNNEEAQAQDASKIPAKGQLRPPVQRKVMTSTVTPIKSCLKTSKCNSSCANLYKTDQSPKRVTWGESWNRVHEYFPSASRSMSAMGLEEEDSLEDSYTDYEAEESHSSYKSSSSEDDFCAPVVHKNYRTERNSVRGDEMFDKYSSQSKGTSRAYGKHAPLDQPVIMSHKCCTGTCNLSNSNEDNFVTWLRNVTEIWKDIKNCSCSHNQTGVRCIQELNAAGVSEDSDNLISNYMKYRIHGSRKHVHRPKRHISLSRKRSQTNFAILRHKPCNTDANTYPDEDFYDMDNEKNFRPPVIIYDYIEADEKKSSEESPSLTLPNPIHSVSSFDLPKIKHVAGTDNTRTDKLIHPTELNCTQTSANQPAKIKEPLSTSTFSRSCIGIGSGRDQHNGDLKNQLPSKVSLEPKLKNEVKKISPQSTAQLDGTGYNDDPLEVSKSSTTDARSVGFSKIKSMTQQGKSKTSGENETECDVVIQNSNTTNECEDLAPLLDSNNQKVKARTISAAALKKKTQEPDRDRPAKGDTSGDIDIHQKLGSPKYGLAYPKKENVNTIPKHEATANQGGGEIAQDPSPEMEMADVKEGDVDTISSDSNDPKYKAQKLFETIIKSGIPENVEEEENSCEAYLRELLAESLSEKAPNNKQSGSKLHVTEDTKDEPECEAEDDCPTYASDTSCDVSLDHDEMPNKPEQDNQDDLNAKAQSIIALLNKIRSSSDVVVGESGVGEPNGNENTNIENTIQTLCSLVSQMQASNNSNEEEECRSEEEDYSQVDEDCSVAYSDDFVSSHEADFPRVPTEIDC